MSADLAQVAGVVRRETGIAIKDAQLPSLEAALRRMSPPMDAATFLRAGADRDTATALLNHLIDEVTVRETFFFRQRRELDAVDWRRLLEGARAAGRDSLRVWVAACASGEEAYTLAILASDALGPEPPPISILATDISTAALEHARRGRYGRRALRALDPQARERHFLPAGDGICVRPELRELVEFRRHNLVHDPVPALGGESFDLIACRNVLIYFDSEAVERAIGLLERALAPQGMLVLGAADRLCSYARRLAHPDPSPPPARAPAPVAPERALRRPLGREPVAGPAPEAGLGSALRAANEGRLDDTVEATASLLRDDPLDADAYFVRGLAELGLGDAEAAAGSLRRALYIDPAFGLAAFELGRAHEARGDGGAAARAYEQAIRTLDPADPRHASILDQVDIGDVAGACSIRLGALRAPADPGRATVGGAR